jgi:hypothetical protein
MPQCTGYEWTYHNHYKQFLKMGSGFRYRVSGCRLVNTPGRLRFLTALCLLALLLASCDIVEAPYTETTDNGQAGINPQKVLLFDFTGHTCKSCPKAHASIELLAGLYGDRLVPVTFHLGYFAKPLSAGKFTTDFRTPEGTLLEKYFDFVSFPVGTVQSLGQSELEPYATWPALVSADIQGDAPVKIEIVSKFLHGLNTSAPEITITALKSISGQLNLAVYLVENGIIDWQKDEDSDPMDIPDYVHNQVFRTSFNGLWGQPVGSADGIVKGFTYATEFSKVLNAGWNHENCTIIAFVYLNETKEIVQVESVELEMTVH